MRIAPIILAFSVITLCAISPVFLSSQTNAIVDSLKNELPKHGDFTRVKLLNDISIEMCYVDVQKAQSFANDAQKLARAINDTLGLGRSIWALGYSHHLLGDYQKAEAAHLEALAILQPKGSTNFLRAVYSELGQIYSSQGAYQKSLDYLEKGLEISKKLENDINIGTLIFGVANNYSALGNYSKAFEILEESKPLILHRPHLIYYYAILGDVHTKSGSPKKGLEALHTSADLCLELEDTLRLAYMNEAIGKIYANIGEYESAADYYFNTIKLNEKLGISSLELVCHLGLGNLFRLWGEADKSKQYYKNALQIAEANDLNIQVYEAHLGLGLLSMKKEQYPTAQEHFEKSLALAKASNAPHDVINSLLNLSDIHVINREYATALSVLSEAINYIPDEKDLQSHFYFPILSKKGEVYLKKANYQQCISTLLSALNVADGEEDINSQKNIYKNLSTAYEKVGDTQSSLVHYKKYSELKEIEQQTLNSELITEMRTRFETEEKQKEVALLEHKTAIQSLSLSNQQTELSRKETHVFLLGLLLLLASVLFWSLFSRFKWRKESEQLRLKKQQIELEKRHLETNQQLEFAELRSKVFTNISHEFRTSLTLILSPLESILSGLKKGSKESHQMMHRNAKKLLELVNETLDLAKLESGHLPLVLSQGNINQFINEIVLHFSPMADAKNISVSIQQSNKRQNMAFDKIKLEKAISNLLSNAFEHCASEGEILITINDDHPNTLSISIQDNGKGIPPEHLPFIFDRFYQVDKNSTKGTGIGLALVKEIVELHQGQISVNSTLGKETIFELTIPITHEIPGAAAANMDMPSNAPATTAALPPLPLSLLSNTTSQGNELTILVAEDHPEVQHYIASGLSKLGKVITASNGEEALNLARKHSPDIIVCDVMMPKLEGFALTKLLKSELQTSHIPILLLTAKASQTSTLSGLKAGADDYLTKPFNMEELQLRITNQIEQRSRLRRLFSAKQKISVAKMTMNKLDKEFLERALRIAKQNLEYAEFNVEKFAHDMGMSRTNLFTKLKNLTGKNISGFIRTLRIQKATDLIRSNSGNMNEIAYQIGFNSRQAFIKAFKQEMGKTPSAFKKVALSSPHESN